MALYLEKTPNMNRYYILLLLTILFSLTLHAQNVTVGSSGDYSSLSAAAPQVGPGDTIFVLDGTQMTGQFLTINGSPNGYIVIIATNEHQAIFNGGSEAIHLVNCSYVEINGLIIEQQTGNGINIDDGGDYNTPTHHITIRDCIFRDMAASGNNDLLKLSGLDSFLIEKCAFLNGGAGGSGIDMVGCHWGVIQDNLIDNAGQSGIQNKGGTQYILMRRNILKDMSQRAINLGGSTGLQFFRPPLPPGGTNLFEAADLEVYSNIFIRSWAPIAYVGCVRVKVINNTIIDPQNWVIRILQENTNTGFLPCGDNEFRNNIVYVNSDLTEVNIGPNTDEDSFVFTNNLWYKSSPGGWNLILPVIDSNQIIGNPLFVNIASEDFRIPPNSPAVGVGKVLSEPKTDYDQNFYVMPPSIGAFEGHESIIQSAYDVQNAEISVFPNPSANQITIEGDFGQADIRITNLSGTTVQNLNGKTSPIQIELTSLIPGIYFLQINSTAYSNMHLSRLIVVD